MRAENLKASWSFFYEFELAAVTEHGREGACGAFFRSPACFHSTRCCYVKNGPWVLGCQKYPAWRQRDYGKPFVREILIDYFIFGQQAKRPAILVKRLHKVRYATRKTYGIKTG